jgi:hypothetical protein
VLSLLLLVMVVVVVGWLVDYLVGSVTDYRTVESAWK